MAKWNGMSMLVILLVIISSVTILLQFFNYTLDAITASLQTVTLLIQVFILRQQNEIQSRQTFIFEAEYQPSFKIEKRDTTYQIADHTLKSYTKPGYYLVNKGRYPVYNLRVNLVKVSDQKEERITKPSKGMLQILLPEKDHLILEFDDKTKKKLEIKESKIKVRITYKDILGERREMTFIKMENSEEFTLSEVPIYIK
ncbi:MAG: hypothetical protein ACTSR0_05975 [Candidatus Asgardarchaeia archaeon]